MMQYIQLKTGIQYVAIRSVSGREKTIMMNGDNADRTTYLDAQRAKRVAFALLEAAKQMERQHDNVGILPVSVPS